MLLTGTTAASSDIADGALGVYAVAVFLALTALTTAGAAAYTSVQRGQ
jgi:hypothetical protein